MKNSKQILTWVLGLSLIGSIGAASSQSILAQDTTEETTTESVIIEPVEEMAEMDHSEMEHDDEGRLPGGIKIKREPTYKVGDEVILSHGHMPGMEGAEAVIVAAFETTAYEISYTPTDGGEPVLNHRWIVHEEIADSTQDTVYQIGDQIIVDAYHMEGMEGATATIDDMTTETVYLIDYYDTETGELVINHKWVVEDEVMPVDGEAAETTEEDTTAEETTQEETSNEETTGEETTAEETTGETSEEESSEEESSEEDTSDEE